ncbi:MAG: DsbA family protein [Pyrobaculum sp.]
MIFRKRARLTPITKTDVVKKLLDNAIVKIGNSNKAVMVFFDLKCPFCAKLFRETDEMLLEIANRGLITYAMCDYVIHKEALPLHKALRCLDERERLKFIKEVFSGKMPEVANCQKDLGECTKLAEEAGVYGTPTLLFYDFTRGRGYLHFGYMTLDEVLEAISSL